MHSGGHRLCIPTLNLAKKMPITAYRGRFLLQISPVGYIGSSLEVRKSLAYNVLICTKDRGAQDPVPEMPLVIVVLTLNDRVILTYKPVILTKFGWSISPVESKFVRLRLTGW